MCLLLVVLRSCVCVLLVLVVDEEANWQWEAEYRCLCSRISFATIPRYESAPWRFQERDVWECSVDSLQQRHRSVQLLHIDGVL